jgi:hypothetical protein
LAIEATRLGEDALIAIACVALVLGAAAFAVAEGPRWIAVSEDT